MNEACPASSGFIGWFNKPGWRDIIIATPYGWLIAFFFVPFLIVVAMSFAMTARSLAAVRLSRRLALSCASTISPGCSRTTSIVRAFLISIYNAAIATVLCLLLGYPMALGLTRVSRSWRNFLLMLVILPFWTSFLLRVYAWIGLHGHQQLVQQGPDGGATMPSFRRSGTIRSMQMMNTNFAVVLVMVYSYLPFMILPLYANLEKLDYTLNEAAIDLGSRPWRCSGTSRCRSRFRASSPAVCSVFIPASGELIIPSLVGNAADPMIGRVISDQFAMRARLAHGVGGRGGAARSCSSSR